MVLGFFFSLISIMETFRVGTLNVNGARNVRKRATLYEMSKVKRIDILFFTRNAQ